MPSSQSAEVINRGVAQPGSALHKLEIADKSAPVLIVAEGLLPYLPEDKTRELMARLADQFPNSQVLLEIFASWAVGREWMVTEFKEPKNPYELAQWDARFKTLAVENIFSHHRQQWRLLWHIFKTSESIRNNLGSRIITLQLNKAA